MGEVAMVEAFRRWARDAPDRPALTVDDVTVTFGELEARSNQGAQTAPEATQQ